METVWQNWEEASTKNIHVMLIGLHLSDFKISTSAEPRMILCLDIREIHTAPCRYTGQTSKLTGVGFYTTSLFSERTTACNASDSDPPG
jgi:hypothetical protein